uniref:Fatty acyl-CoA reductase n=1 Tax=Corethrella appendiculata TaxID=1370023 RepID=U5EPY7_9DIPT
MSQTAVQKYYDGKSIFITGGTGFMGKVLLEKLLYGCSDLKQVFVLMRPKRGKVPQQRIDDMFKLPCFQRIRDEKPEVWKKLKPIQGDVTFDGLGISRDELEIVLNETDIVFHCAATLKLEACLKDAIEMNTTGTRRIIELGKKMKRLSVLVHLSTAFCYCDKEVLAEKVHDFTHNPYDLMRTCEWMDEKSLDLITPNLLKPHPNTYTYSKRLAEMLIRDNYPDLPACIVRPSIVTPSFKEPVEGWVDSLNGPIGIMVGGGKGVIRSMLCNPEYNAEVIPVDIAINGLICIAYTMGQMKELPKEIPVYNITCKETKRTTWREVLEMGKELCYKYPFEAGVWYPDGDITTNKVWHVICAALFHWLPAYFIDFLMFCFGQKRFMLRIQRRIADGLELLQFFTTRQWDFRSHQFQAIPKTLLPDDQKLFNTNVDEIDTYEYMGKIILGGRQYCLKEPLSSLPKARVQLKMLYVLDKVTKLFFLWLFAYAILSVTGLKDHFSNLFSSSVRHEVI